MGLARVVILLCRLENGEIAVRLNVCLVRNARKTATATKNMLYATSVTTPSGFSSFCTSTVTGGIAMLIIQNYGKGKNK